MRRAYTLLALGVVLLGGSAGWAGEIGAAQLPMDAMPRPATTATPAPSPVKPAEPAPLPAVSAVPVSAGAPCCGCATERPCCGRATGHCHGEFPCLQRLADWLTYCPPMVPCHMGCCGCCGHKCTPCCMPPYMYFLDRCSCTQGYQGGVVVPPGSGAAEDSEPAGPAGPGGGPAESSYRGTATAGR
jgi:hypothetical protein